MIEIQMKTTKIFRFRKKEGRRSFIEVHHISLDNPLLKNCLEMSKVITIVSFIDTGATALFIIIQQLMVLKLGTAS